MLVIDPLYMFRNGIMVMESKLDFILLCYGSINWLIYKRDCCLSDYLFWFPKLNFFFLTCPDQAIWMPVRLLHSWKSSSQFHWYLYIRLFTRLWLHCQNGNSYPILTNYITEHVTFLGNLTKNNLRKKSCILAHYFRVSLHHSMGREHGKCMGKLIASETCDQGYSIVVDHTDQKQGKTSKAFLLWTISIIQILILKGL